jgi:hypothetical protein
MVEGTFSGDLGSRDPRYYTKEEANSICTKAKFFLDEYFGSEKDSYCSVCMTKKDEGSLNYWVYCKCFIRICGDCHDKIKREGVCPSCKNNLERALKDIEQRLFRSSVQKLLHLPCTCSDIEKTKSCMSCRGKFLFSEELKDFQDLQDLQDIQKE